MRFTFRGLILSTAVFLTSCGNRISNEEIKKSWWLYGSGYRIGDALRFDDTNLKGDTIYRENKPVAIITYSGKGMLRQTAILEVESIVTGESGTYHDKGPK